MVIRSSAALRVRRRPPIAVNLIILTDQVENQETRRTTLW